MGPSKNLEKIGLMKKYRIDVLSDTDTRTTDAALFSVAEDC